MTTGLPSPKQVLELLGREFTRAGFEIEDVVIDARARPPRITVIADGDSALDLDTIAALSHTASSLLDGLDGPNGSDGPNGGRTGADLNGRDARDHGRRADGHH